MATSANIFRWSRPQRKCPRVAAAGKRKASIGCRSVRLSVCLAVLQQQRRVAATRLACAFAILTESRLTRY